MSEANGLSDLTAEIQADMDAANALRSSRPPPYPERSKKSKSRAHLVRKRTLKRGCSYELFADAHVKYVWAAYKKGGFQIIEKPDLSPAEFRVELLAMAMNVLESGGDWYVLKSAPGMPVGIASVAFHKLPEIVVQITPHVVWLPWATPRNKLECALRFLADIKGEGNILITAREPNWRFFNHLCKYGLLRPVGKLRKHYEDGTDSMLFEGVR